MEIVSPITGSYTQIERRFHAFFHYCKDHSISEFENSFTPLTEQNIIGKTCAKKFEKECLSIEITNDTLKKPHNKSCFEFSHSSEHYIIHNLGDIKH